MKKLFYLLLALPLAFIAVSCDDDDKIPDVSLDVQFDGATLSGDTLYVVQDSGFVITNVILDNHTGKEGTLGSTSLYLDRIYQGSSNVYPFQVAINTSDTSLGNHVLGISSQVFVVDYPVSIAATEFIVKIVPDVESLPAGPDTPTLSGATKVSAN